MKKIMFLAMLVASGAIITGCSKDDPFTESENYGGSSVSLSSYSGGNGMGGGPGGWR